MKNGQPFRCYRCNSVTQYLSTTADATPTPGELTISFECPDCGQRYELQLIPVAIFATSTEGEAQALLHYCSRCVNCIARRRMSRIWVVKKGPGRLMQGEEGREYDPCPDRGGCLALSHRFALDHRVNG